ncbi:MAG TPA: tetratricopeptide repeat protein [Anaerolineales bacterium]|nr:tetratricopeptide repeat protein [Anaerolineales bacterium]
MNSQSGKIHQSSGNGTYTSNLMMPELTDGFQSLPPEYQRVLQLAQDQYRIRVVPLQTLVGGWSGAVVYLVSVSWSENGRVEHCILKLDRKSKTAKSDEVTRHNAVLSKSTPEFARTHIAELVFDRLEHEGAIAIFYRIAGQSLFKYRPLANYERENQLKTIFAQTNHVLLDKWNANSIFEQAVHPQKLLEKWLGFRLEAGGNIERFLKETCQVDSQIAGLLVNGHVFPNPLLYARKTEVWDKTRSIDIATGFIHGDLNTNNILVKFSEDKESLEGYYLIDFALFKEGMPLFYDQRYLEISYLMHAISQISFSKCVNFLTLLAVTDIPDPRKVPIELSGVSAVIGSARGAFEEWVTKNHPSLHDDLWGQYWLAGVAAGLAYTHKAGQPHEQRLAGLIYACANLRRYTAIFKLPLPTNVELVYDENQADKDSPGTFKAKRLKHNLPAQPTPFIGRASQIAALKELILNPDVRLITLLGPGGAGKTRLSLQVTQESLEHFPDSAFFVPLADDTDLNQFISRVAQQLEVREGGRPLLENIKDYLRDKSLLLVLDNFEQLMSSASIVADLLAAAPQLKIITSSRIPLKLHSEHEFPVPPLELPLAANDGSVEDLLENESVLLFVRRAQAVHPNFALTKDNASAIAEICRRLDGLPLALELAAARVKLLPPQAILTRLDDRFKLLTGGARDLPSRHQTLRNTLEWSYSLLTGEEKTLFARLSVFVGGITLEAAEAVCNADAKLDVFEGLTSLVNNSLLRQDEVNGEPRFSMLETIRAYAIERLAESGEMETLQARHASYFGDVLLQVQLQLYSDKALYWLNWFEQENDNIRATLSWCLAVPQGGEMGANLIFALFWFWYRRGYAIEGRIWADRFLATPSLQSPSPLRMIVLAASGMLSLWHGEQEMALTRLQESLAIEYRIEDEFMTATLQMANAIAYINMGRDAQAKSMLEQSRALFQGLQVAPFIAITTIHLGNVELGLGNPEQARALHEQALAIARSIGESWMLSFALNNLGEVARVQGQYELARKYYKESEALLRATGDQGDLARFVHNLGYIAQHEEDFELAESQFRESLAMFRRLGNRRGIAECLAGLAGLIAQQGHTKRGATLLGAAESLLKVTGGAWWPADRVEVERNREMLRSALGADEFAKAWKKGEELTLDQAIHFASDESET